MSDRTKPRAPEPSNSTREYWEQVMSGVLALPYCPDCEEFFFYPRGRCPVCRNNAVEYRESSGRGTVVSYTTVHRPPISRLKELAPYVNALIELEEGIQMMANLDVESESDIEIGTEVEVTFVETEGEYDLPYFTPVNTA